MSGAHRSLTKKWWWWQFYETFVFSDSRVELFLHFIWSRGAFKCGKIDSSKLPNKYFNLKLVNLLSSKQIGAELHEREQTCHCRRPHVTRDDDGQPATLNHSTQQPADTMKRGIKKRKKVSQWTSQSSHSRLSLDFIWNERSNWAHRFMRSG